MNGLVSLVGALLTTQAVNAPAPISLADAIRISLKYSTAVAEAESDYAAARARTGQDVSRQLPQLNFGASVTRFDNRTTVTFPGSDSRFELEPNNQETLSLALTQDLDLSGQLGLSVAQSKLKARSALYAVRAVTADQALNTTAAYFAVLRAQENLRVAAAALAAYREQQLTTTRLYRGGVGQRIDVDRSDSQVAEAESEVARRENELHATRSALNDLLGVPLDQPTQLADPSAETSFLDAPADISDRAALIAKALDVRPEALQAAIEVQAFRKGIQIARSTAYPSLLLGISGDRYPTTSFAFPRQNVAALTLSLNAPIFDGGLAREKVREARADVASAQARQDRIRRDIALQVQNAALDVDTALKRRAAAEVEVKAATAARKLAQQRFESQVGLYIEVTDAESALTSAEAAQVQAIYDLLIARAQLAHALSDPITK